MHWLLGCGRQEGIEIKARRKPLGRPGEPRNRHPAPGDLHVFTGFHGIQKGR